MKVYPHPANHSSGINNHEGGFTIEEINQGDHWLRTDVECISCHLVQSLANAGSTDNGRCVRCGGKTS